MHQSDDRRIRHLLRRVAPAEAEHALLHVLPPERLEQNPWAVPVGMDSESMDQLTEEIIRRGLQEALLARRLPGDRYQVLIGGRTLEAARRIPRMMFPVVVTELADDAAIAIALAEAVTRERLSSWEVAEGLAQLVDGLHRLEQDASRERLAVLLDHTTTWIDRLQFIAKRLSPAVLARADVSVHQMNTLSEDALLHAAEPSDPNERARRLRELQHDGEEQISQR